jgi:hypothetical protein
MTAAQEKAFKRFLSAFDHVGWATLDAPDCIISGQSAKKKAKRSAHFLNAFMSEGLVELVPRCNRYHLTQDGINYHIRARKET